LLRRRDPFGHFTLPPLATHSEALAASYQPWPLHEFFPLHEDEAVLQALVPLHEFTPAHLTLSCAEADAKLPAANKAAAVAEKRMRLLISDSLALA
jgi:hypothetical protein